MRIRSLIVAAFAFLATTSHASAVLEEFTGPAFPAGWTAWDGYAAQLPGDPANHAQFQMTGSQLSISFPGGQEHNMWLVRHASALRPYLGSGIYETKVDSSFTGDQQAGLVFQQDSANFLIFMLYSYTGNTVKGYVERFSYVNGQLHKTTFYGGSIGVGMPAAGPFYIRVAVDDDASPQNREWEFSWSADGSLWNPLVSGFLEGAAPEENAGTLASVGVFAGNQPLDFSAFDARFDYFRYYSDVNSLPLAAPANVVARGGESRADVWWDPVVGAQSYRVYGSTSQAGTYTLLGTTSQTSFGHAGITNGTDRYYIVKGLRDGVEGAPAAAVRAVPHSLGALASLPSQGMILSLAASELGYTLSNGADVTHWPNTLGSTTHAFSPSHLAPTFVTGALNGQPVVRFNGTDESLELPDGFANFNSGMSMFVVARPTAAQYAFKLVLLGTEESSHYIGLGRAGASSGFQFFNDGAAGVAWFNTQDGFVVNEPALISVLQEAGPTDGLAFAELAKNGFPLYGQNVNVPPVAARTKNYLGKSFWADDLFAGDVAEVLVYDRILTQQEREAVLDYFEDKYNLGILAAPPPPPMGAPSGVTANAGNAVVNLSWNSVAEATGYRVYRATSPSTTYSLVATRSAADYTDTAVANGTTYLYKVSATKPGEESPLSAEVSARPISPPVLDPQLPTSGLLLALDAETAALQFDNGQAVTVWQDESAANNDATAGSGAPTLVTNAINGKPVLRFDGSDDFLQLPSGFSNFTAGMSLYVVARPTTLQHGFKLLVLGNGAGQQNIGLGRAGSTSGYQYWTDSSASGVSWFNTSSALTAGQASVVSLLQQAGPADSYSFAEVASNGIPLFGQNMFVPPVTSRGINYIGKSYWADGMFQGDVAEVLLYDRILTPTEQSAVHDYLEAKYAITLP